MRRLAAVLLTLAWSLLLLGETCGADTGDKQKGEPCTRGRECAAPLVCQAGICDEPGDASMSDAGE